MSEVSNHDFAVVFDSHTDWKFTFSGLLAVDNLPFQLLTRIEIETLRISNVTAGSHNIEVVFFANLANSVVVSNAKSVRLRCLKFVENFAILVSAFIEWRVWSLGSNKK